MTIGIFLDKHHINYIPHLAFVTAQAAELDDNDITVYSYDNSSMLSEYSLCDVNIFFNRYCFIDFNKIPTDFINHIYTAQRGLHTPIISIPKKKIKNRQISVRHLIWSYANKTSAKIFTNICYLKNINLIQCNLNQAVFICFDDLSTSHMQDMQNCFYKSKEIFYNNKIYNVDPFKQIFPYKDTECCKINRMLRLFWDKKNKKWKKLGAKIKC